MLPVIAIVGRPNVGKSTLFNCITQTRNALVADQAGLTRDRQYGIGKLGDRPYIVIDTGGLHQASSAIDQLTIKQTQQAMLDADRVLFLVDGKAGLTESDKELARQLRQMNKPICLVVNKVEGRDLDVITAEFYALGLTPIYPIAAVHGTGVRELLQQVLSGFPESETALPETGTKVAIVGRPNVGKSTLTNRILGEERVIVCDMPGTTRDSIYIPFTRGEQHYTLIDTAGIRRRSRIEETIEKFSVVKTLQAINDANVVICMLDAQQGVTEQDLSILGMVVDTGKGLLITVNKWDHLPTEQREMVKSELERRLNFVAFAPIHFISALHGTGVGDLFKTLDKIYHAACKKLSTPQLTRLLASAQVQHQPPLVQGRRIKLRYAHQGGSNPPVIVIHGNQTQRLPDSYRRFLMTYFRKALRLTGTPIRLEFKDSKNPYQGRSRKRSTR